MMNQLKLKVTASVILNAKGLNAQNSKACSTEIHSCYYILQHIILIGRLKWVCCNHFFLGVLMATVARVILTVSFAAPVRVSCVPNPSPNTFFVIIEAQITLAATTSPLS